MKKTHIAALCIGLLALTSAAPSLAGEDMIIDADLSMAMNSQVVQDAIPPGVKIYFAGQPVAIDRIVAPTRSSRRTSRANHGVGASCNKALANVLKAMGEQAVKHGANAVVNLKSNNMNIVTESSTTFKCRLGGSLVNVALVGELAVVK
jgi:hypothetical protein